MKKPDWLTAALIVSVATGGMATSLLNRWLEGRKESVTVEYRIVETEAGAFKQTGRPAFYYAVDLRIVSGQLKELGIGGATKYAPLEMEVFSSGAPPLHNISCGANRYMFECKLNPVNTGQTFRVTLMADGHTTLTLNTDNSNVSLVPFPYSWGLTFVWFGAGALIAALVFAKLRAMIQARRTQS
jgi:hypothetical protein